jgi:PAS domain S-box-containing protein
MSAPDLMTVPTARRWFAAIAGLIALLVAGLYYSHALLRDHAREMAEQQLRATAELKAREIQRWLDDRLAFLAEPPDGVIAQHLARLLHDGNGGAARALRARIDHMHAQIPEITSIWLHDPTGRAVLGSNTSHALDDARHEAALRQALATRRPVLVDFHRSGDAADAVVLDILVPLIAGPRQTAIGYLRLQIDPRLELYPLIGLWPVPSDSAESLLVRREDDAIVALTPLRHSDAPPLSLRRPLDTPGLIAGRALRGEGEVLAGVDYRGVAALGVALRIPDTPWLLVAKMDDEEIYRDAERDFLWIAAAALILVAALLVLGYMFAAALQARAREARYRMLAESGSDMVWLYELAQQRFTYVSPSVESLRGYTVAEGLGQSMADVLTPQSHRLVAAELPKWIAAFEAGDESARTRYWELTQPCKDGTTIETEAVATLITDTRGRVTHIQGISRDIGERKRIEAALAESEEKFRTIYDAINDAIFVHDAASGRILDVNAGACLMYGYGREHLLELDVAAISANVPPYTMADAGQVIGIALEKGWHAFEWRARDSADRLFWVAVNLKPLKIGGVQCILAVVRDIDSRRHAEEDLKQALAEAKALNAKLAEAQSQLLQSEKMASIGQLAAGVAHELNNPIGFVSSNLGSLESYLKDIFAILAAYEAAEADGGAQCPRLDVARALKRDRDFDFLKTDIVQLMAESKDGLARVAKIVRDLKDFSRAGDATYHWADLHQGLESTLNIVWNELKYKCVVKKEYGELPPVWCVPSQLNQVFMNLLVNAAHAIPEKGEIVIRTSRRGDEVCVAISDTGTGIAPEHLNRIFDPFFTTKPVGKGTGLGLSLAYSIVQKHQGRIEVSSELGKGTTFGVWLPIEAKTDATVPPAPTS